MVSTTAAQDYLQHLDLDKVRSEIERESILPDFELSDAGRLTWLAAEAWLPGDLENLLDYEVEKKADDGSAVYDLVGNHRGEILCVDYKTTTGELDERWRQYNVQSWQHKIYLSQLDTQKFQYRGISRHGTVTQLDLYFPDRKRNNGEVAQYLNGVTSLRDALAQYYVYPRHRPHACRAYGRPCPWITDCADYTMPEQLVYWPTHMSYSQAERLLLCPERARRVQLDPQADETEEGAFGLAVHRGIAEIWRQAKEKFL